MIGINNILKKIQVSKATHQKELKILRMHYDKIPLEDFFEKIRIVLKQMFSINTISRKNCYVERTLEFLAQFVADVTPEGTNDDISDECTHPFLTMIIKDTLKYHNLTNEYLRYNSCLFVRLILHNVGSNKNLDNEVCDLIEEAMLERTLDPKPTVRLQAVLALIRLQDPMNAESPVSKAYLSLIVDANAQIRAEVVKNIAPYNISVLQIVNRLRDIDINVRIIAFRRCADLGPRAFKIFERQHILTCGLNESNQKVKNVFIENMLPKWLNAYENNYITFFNALKLDADENDIVNTQKITTDVLNLLLRSTPINEINSILPLDENKIIPFDKLASEAVVVWNILILYLRENDNMEDYLENIIPDLTPFCQYIESLVIEKRKNKMEDWEYLDYQYILNNLLGIAESYDFSDEVGRKTLHQLTIKLLREENLLFKLKEKLVALSAKTAENTDNFTSKICHIISEIQEPLIEKHVEVSSTEDTDKECQKAELRVKIIELEAKLEEATDSQEYLKADTLKNEINGLKTKLQDLSVIKVSTETTKVIKDDPKTICECLDILTCMLSLPSVNTMTPSLVAVKDEFVVPLLNSNASDINWRVIKCIALFCVLEENLAEEYLKVICIPIITYKAIPNYNKQALMIAVRAIPDMFRLYGVNVFGSMDNAIGSNSNQSLNSTTSNKRKLYRTEESDESVIFTNKFHLESIIEVILDMLDDEISEIRNIALEAISKLILNQFPASPLLISRLILKWYNPLTAQASDNSQQLIGVVISNFAKSMEGAKEVIAKAVIPILQSIARAPRTSPLAVVDVDNLLLFISTITDFDEKIDVSRTHINMAHMFTSEILKKKNEAIAIYLSKLLLYLNISLESSAAVKELLAQVETALEDENFSEKTLRKNLVKFQQKLNVLLENYNRTQDENLTENSNIVTIIEENQENSTTENTKQIDSSKDLKQHRRNTILPSIREVEEEDLFELSDTNRVSDVQKNLEEEAIIGIDSNENVTNEVIENTEKIKNTENNNENTTDSNDNKEEKQSTKIRKVPIVVINKNEIKQNKKNKDSEEVVLQHLNKNKESDESDTNSEENVISATPEDDSPNVSKSKKRKRPESDNNILPRINILQVVTIKPQTGNSTQSKKGETSSDSGSIRSTRSSSNSRLKAKNINLDKSTKEKAPHSQRLLKSKYGSGTREGISKGGKRISNRSLQLIYSKGSHKNVKKRHTLEVTSKIKENDRESASEISSDDNVKLVNKGPRLSKISHENKEKTSHTKNIVKNKNNLDTSQSTSGASFDEDVGNRKSMRSKNKRLLKLIHDKNKKQKINSTSPKIDSKLNNNTLIKTSQNSSEPKNAEKENNIQLASKRKQEVSKNENSSTSDSQESPRRRTKRPQMRIQQRKIIDTQKVQRLNNSSTTNEANSDSTDNQRHSRSGRIRVEISQQKINDINEIQKTKSSSTTEETSSDSENIRYRKKRKDEQNRYTLKEKKIVQKKKNNSTTDETNSDSTESPRHSKRNKLQLPELRIVVSPNVTSEKVGSETSKETRLSTGSGQTYNTRKNGGIKNNQEKLLAREENIRKRKQLTVCLVPSPSTSKRMRLMNKSNSEADKVEKTEIKTYSLRKSNPEINFQRIISNKTLSEISKLRRTRSSNASTTLHTILSEISQLEVMHDDSSFSSPNSFHSRQRTRLQTSSPSSPIIKKHMSKKISTSINLENEERPARKFKKKPN